MADIYQFASRQWRRIGNLHEEIMEGLEGEGEREAFEVAVRGLGEKLAAAQTVEERKAWAKEVVGLINGVPEVAKVLGLEGGGSFGFDDGTVAHGKVLHEQKRGKSEKEARIEQDLVQPAVDEKKLSFGERVRRLLGMKG